MPEVADKPIEGFSIYTFAGPARSAERVLFMNTGFDYHPLEEVLEAYAMGKLSDQESGPLEEHLLICLACQNRLEAVDDFIQVARAATESMPPHPPARARRLACA